MKRVVSGTEPAVLAAFRAAHPQGTWEQFRNERGNEIVFDTLVAVQGHLCAYCEIRISRPLLGSIEHFEPKSTATIERNLDLEYANLIAVCDGGTRPSATSRTEKPVRETMHCGPLKGERQPVGLILDPRHIPIAPSFWRTTTLGHLEVDQAACLQLGIDPSLAESTLSVLGLNRRLLVRQRGMLIQELDRELFSSPVDDEGVPARMIDVAGGKLLPDDEGRLTEFWSTIRAWAPSAIERFIASHAGEIPGMT